MQAVRFMSDVVIPTSQPLGPLFSESITRAGWSVTLRRSIYGLLFLHRAIGMGSRRLRSIASRLTRRLCEERLDDFFQVGPLAFRAVYLLRLVFLDGQHFSKFFMALAADVFVKGHRLVWFEPGCSPQSASAHPFRSRADRSPAPFRQHHEGEYQSRFSRGFGPAEHEIVVHIRG